MGREHERVREREEGKRERGAFSRVGLGRLGLGPLRQSLLEDKPSLLPRLQTRQLFMLKLSERSRHDLEAEHTEKVHLGPYVHLTARNSLEWRKNPSGICLQ